MPPTFDAVSPQQASGLNHVLQITSSPHLYGRTVAVEKCTSSIDGIYGMVVEAWGQGLLIGSLVILVALTVASMRRKVLLHKLILAELIFATFHGTFIFVEGPPHGWYVSATATLLFISYNLHNLINWIKIKPFLSKWPSRIYIGTVVLVIPYWIVESILNFFYNNDKVTTYFRQTRPWEALCREPWWLFTTAFLIYTIRRSYDCTFIELFKASGRFGILMLSMALSIVFVIFDVVDVGTGPATCAGRNPYWKLTLIFKCTADTIFLDDFKSVLNKLTIRAKGNVGPEHGDTTLGGEDDPALADQPRVPARSSFRERLSAAISRRGHSEPSRVMSNVSHATTLGRSPSNTNPSVSVVRSTTKTQPPQHIETLPSPSTSVPRRQTKEWFDVIDPE